MRIACIASGRGSNFAALLAAIKEKRIPRAEMVALLTNNPKADAVEIARRSNVPVVAVDSNLFKRDGKLDGDRYEAELVIALEKLKPDWILLAGYMLRLGERVLKSYPDHILNIHPSLLPSFKGLHAQRQALEAGVKWTGCTVHFVNEELDGGRIIEQSVLRVEEGDTEESLSMRLLPLEHETYVRALQQLV